MWGKLSHIFQSLTGLTSKNKFFKWTNVEQKYFDEAKQIVAHNVITKGNLYAITTVFISYNKST